MARENQEYHEETAFGTQPAMQPACKQRHPLWPAHGAHGSERNQRICRKGCPHLRCMPSMSSVIFLVTAYLARRQFFTARMWLRAFRAVSAVFCALSPLAPCSTPFPLLCVRFAARYSSKVSICRRHQVSHANESRMSKQHCSHRTAFYFFQYVDRT